MSEQSEKIKKIIEDYKAKLEGLEWEKKQEIKQVRDKYEMNLFVDNPEKFKTIFK